MEDPLPSRRLIDGTCLLVNKPQGWTSFDVVNKIRSGLKHSLGLKKIKVGHAGTLDPMATGLLIICTGKSTKKLADYQGLSKEYIGTITLGATTPSYDAETEPDAIFPTDHISEEELEVARQRFIGDIEQVPPMFSAIKVDGQPLYKKARQGIVLEVAPRPVTIYEFEYTNVNLPTIDFRVECSKGTYIRSLAFDLGKALNSGGYLSALCRTKVGKFKLEDAWDLEALMDHIESFEPNPAT
ncbi:MAG: tRNA pseudouridine(55) synthase TruB [Saprospiraceae bacterium]|nr:tRNA pseudouridine(55) synthase TruB [Saprospiraceae bacterium]MCF8250218.1 tRNA pseudouridine(55) synthase TruB [Saprospiraceae bacterium]MCF8280019.1 tRNA pseudouridine(55) synthase TruB [Bacteroidales bacterium]MCF8312026.1 tRNA pseudouridine(55) synthase TruB [Saprospiraceae bacterium]MCF8441123.1 tRNA pseudouridine(55) synthase TruB [Saprospiraceae bacterium]